MFVFRMARFRPLKLAVVVMPVAEQGPEQVALEAERVAPEQAALERVVPAPAAKDQALAARREDQAAMAKGPVQALVDMTGRLPPGLAHMRVAPRRRVG